MEGNIMNKKLQSYKSSQAKQLLGEEDPKLIIYELLDGLNKNLSSIIENIDKHDIKVAKEQAVKAQNIAFALRKTLDRNNGGTLVKVPTISLNDVFIKYFDSKPISGLYKQTRLYKIF